MSVVIGIDMPKSCYECAKKCGLINHCTAFISEDWGKHDVSCERATNCPILCELPEKHGRYGDLNNLKYRLHKFYLDNEESAHHAYLSGIAQAIEMVVGEPTIIEAEGNG